MSGSARKQSIVLTHPDLAKEWHPTKNLPLVPEQVSAGTNKKIWWLGVCGHEWDAVGASRSRQGTGCPICSNHRVLEGFNDLATLRPDLAAEWHPTKNGALRPQQFVVGTSIKIWWLASCNHEWQATINSRHSNGSKCPICSNQRVLSGFNDLSFLFPEIAAEWHPIKNGSLLPNQVIKGSNKKYWWSCQKGHEWEAKVSSRTSRNSGCPYCQGLHIIQGESDLESKFPELAKEWHPVKNGELTPSEFHPGSNKKAWWLGTCGHEWESVVSSRTSQGVGCPVCSGHKILVGFNDFATTHSELAKEWHPTKNGELTPEQVVRGTRRKVWWLCSNQHEWEAILANRVWGNGCPYCTHQWLLPGENDLETLSPEIARQWHPTKNGGLTPSDIFATTAKKVWWLCEKGHEWDARISNRRSAGLGCPICSNQRLLSGYNDLATLFPTLAEQWHPIKNGELRPSHIAPNADLKPWWLASCGHEWQADVGSRAAGHNCPYCSNQKVLVGFNDLGTTHPDIAAEWHPTKNGNQTPYTIPAGTNKKYWWLGACGHEWDANCASRAINRTGCSICTNQRLLVGYNDLQTLGSEILPEWHPTKNKDVHPAEIVGPSSRKFWWKCKDGHEWLASSGARLRGTKCPNCTTSGYSTASPGVFYFIQNRELNARKVGIANQTSLRLENWVGLGWEVVHQVDSENGLHILNLETVTLRWIRKELGLPPFLGKEEMGRLGGWTETFSTESVANYEVIQKVVSLDLELRDLDE
jgi:hypothetical protein